MSLRNFTIALLSTIVVAFSSCDFLTNNQLSETELNETQFNIPAEGGEVVVRFVPGSSWTVRCNDEWIKCSPSAGDASENETEVIIEAEANDNVESRKTSLVFSFETNEVNVEIVQAGVSVEDTYKDSYEVAAGGEDIVISFVPTAKWNISCESDWIVFDNLSGEAEMPTNVTITVAENKTPWKRSAVVVLSYGDEDIEISITQEAGKNDEVKGDQIWCLAVRDAIEGTEHDLQPMEFQGGFYVFRNFYLGQNLLLRFYEKTSDTFYYGYNTGIFTKTNTRVNLEVDEYMQSIRMYCDGYYDIYIDPDQMCFYIMATGYTPNDVPTTSDVAYDEYLAIRDKASEGQYVKVFGIVVARNKEGFILSLNARYSNYIYVKDEMNCCAVDLGYWVDLYAKPSWNNGFAELVVDPRQYWCHTFSEAYKDYKLEEPLFINDSSQLTPYNYTVVRCLGTLKIAESYCGLVLDGNPSVEVKIVSPIQNLADYDGKKVCVDGLVTGFDNSSINLILKAIYDAEKDGYNGGSTEGLTPGESFPVTKS